MAWYTYLAYFAGGLFLVNGIPHFVEGAAGRKFPTPFAQPPGQGDSSSLVNVFWGLGNLVAGFLLINGVGNFALGLNVATLTVFVGALLMSILLARHFGSVREGASGTG